MTRPDPVLARIPEGIELRQQGRNPEARAVFERLWADIGGESGNPLHRCTIAHSLADAQDDVHEELRWDLAALRAAQSVTDEQVADAWTGGSAAALFPSLHLNLAECYRKIGDLDEARTHVDHARRTVDALPDGEYGAMIRNGLYDLAERLETP